MNHDPLALIVPFNLALTAGFPGVNLHRRLMVLRFEIEPYFGGQMAFLGVNAWGAHIYVQEQSVVRFVNSN